MARGSLRHNIGRTGSCILTAALMATTAIPAAMLFAPDRAFAQTGAQTRFNIPAGPLGRALAAFGSQSGTQVSYDAAIAAGKTSPGVSGAATREQAIAQLLQGSGLSWSFTDPTSVIVSAGSASATAGGAVAADGSLLLDKIDLQGGGNADFAPQDIFRTPGAVANVDRETLDRVPQTSTGDILKGVTGVTVGDNRNGGGFQPNIRGAQGMNRVKVIVDGAEASTSTYRGYGGNSETNYVDPDFLAGFSVEKGPVAEGGGAIGGTIKMRTIEAKDIIKSDRTWALRTKAMIGDNVTGDGSLGKCTSTAASCAISPSTTIVGEDRVSMISDWNYSGSAVGAWRPNDMFEFIGGVARRQSGNYYAGSRGGAPATSTSFYGPGEEVFGTYSNSRSVMLKGAFTPTDEHRLTFGFNRYQNQYADRKTASSGSYKGMDYRYPYPSDVDQKSYTLGYAWTPENNPWFNLKADAWHVDSEEDRARPVNQRVSTVTNGVKLSNRSEIDLPWFTALLDVGGQYRHERVRGQRTALTGGYEGQNDVGNGGQDLYGVYGNLQLPVTEWLTVHGALRHDWYETQRVGPRPSSNHSSVMQSKGDGTAFNAGIVLKPIEELQLYAKYSQGWRAPTMREELLLNANIGGAAIQPEQSENYEFGVNVSKSGLLTDDDDLGVKIGYFDNSYDNYIAGNGFWPGFHNSGGARFKGLEASLRYDLGWAYMEYGLTHYFKTQLCGTSLFGPEYASLLGQAGCFDLRAGDYQSIIGGNIPPTNKHDLTVGLRLLDNRLNIGGTMTHVDGAVVYNANTGQTSNGDYTVFDAFLRYDFDNDLKLNASVANLTDEYYFEAGTQNMIALPAPGRTFRLTLSKDF